MQLTTSRIKVRDSEKLLSDLYPCILCEDYDRMKDYRVRLIFGLSEVVPLDFSNFKDQANAHDMFVVFKAWAHFNLHKVFTSLEIRYMYTRIAAEMEHITFYKLVEALVNLDPLVGVVV